MESHYGFLGLSVPICQMRDLSALLLRPSPGTGQRGSLEQTHSQLPVVGTRASVLSLHKQFRIGGQAVWRNASSS